MLDGTSELYKDNWIGKRPTEAANGIARERNLVQSKDIGKANREEIRQAMDGVLKEMQGFDLTTFKRNLVNRASRFWKPGQAPVN